MAFALTPVLGPVVFQPGGFSPLGLSAWRLGLGAAILVPIMLARRAWTALPAREDLLRFVMASWLGGAFNQALFLEGLARSTPVNAVLMTCLIPVFTFTLAAVFGLERFNGVRLTGVLVAFAGIVPLVLNGGFTTLGRYGLGNLLIAAGAFSYSLYFIVSKPLLVRYPPAAVIAWVYVFSLPFVPWFAWGQQVVPALGHAAVWWALAYIVVFPTVIAYLCNMFALSRLEASTTTIYIYAQPLITGLVSWGAFGETPTRAMLVAAPALFVGVWLVSRRAERPLLAPFAARSAP
ncbi:MAG: DMT family transporter [Gemmatimonadetes bacterium]|nr:DMT family transporter [Gemmatimonadota bacterium]